MCGCTNAVTRNKAGVATEINLSRIDPDTFDPAVIASCAYVFHAGPDRPLLPGPWQIGQAPLPWPSAPSQLSDLADGTDFSRERLEIMTEQRTEERPNARSEGAFPTFEGGLVVDRTACESAMVGGGISLRVCRIPRSARIVSGRHACPPGPSRVNTVP